MTVDVGRFLPPGARVLALPNARAPRLYLASETLRQRWRHSSHYPAFRWTARLHAGAVRVRAALGLLEERPNPGVHWPLGEFLHDCLPDVGATVVAVGMSGPVSKLTVQAWRGDAVVGYVKYAATPAAVARLEHEAGVITALPTGIGPKVLKLADFDGGRALVTSAVAGRVVPARLPMHAGVRAFVASFRQERAWPIERHPWVVRMRERVGELEGERFERALAPLAGAVWPEVIQHGDFAPWNLLRGDDGRLAAVDWEYGDVQGFPHLDAAYYHLQVAALLRRWSPERARAQAVRHLDPALTPDRADALVRLAALGAYHEALVDGHAPSAALQAWRWVVWSGR